jgi:hypothetical protein
MSFPIRIATLALALAAVTAAAADAAVQLAVLPDTVSVAPGDTFMLELRVPVPGSAINAYDAIVEYDPAVLTFLPTAPTSLQQGASMTGACGNTFHFFTAAGDSLSISNSLLCAGLALTGPAHLYTLRFRAPLTPGATHVRLRRAQFYNGGLFVNPAVTFDAVVTWGGTVGVVNPPVAARATLAVRSNPAGGEQWLDLSSPREGEQSLVIFDTAGRAVRHLAQGRYPSGSRAVRWDGRDDAGRAVPPGVYLARYNAAGRSARASLVRLR